MLVALGYQPRISEKIVPGYNYYVWGVSVHGTDLVIEPHKLSKPSLPNEYVASPSAVREGSYDSRSTAYFALRTWRQRGALVCKEQQLKENFPDIVFDQDRIYFKVTDLVQGQGEVFGIEVEENQDYLIDGVVSQSILSSVAVAKP